VSLSSTLPARLRRGRRIAASFMSACYKKAPHCGAFLLSLLLHGAAVPLCASQCQAPHLGVQEAQVERVIDGDTLRLQGHETGFRLLRGQIIRVGTSTLSR